jgi:hypothetical protein
MSNLAALLDDLESGGRAHADTTEQAVDLLVTAESPLTADELETLLGAAPQPRDRERRRLRLVRFRDNFSGDFRPFRVR